MKKIIVCAIACLIAAILVIIRETKTHQPSEQKNNFSRIIMLNDVTDGKPIKNYTTSGLSEGIVTISTDEDNYSIGGSFTGLPELDDGYVYSAWIVKNDPHEFFSPGVLQKKASGFELYYNARIQDVDNYQDYLRFVVSIEKNEGEGPSNTHVLEGGEDR